LLSEALLVAITVGVVVIGFLLVGIRDARRFAATMADREAKANDRLYAAWKEGFQIPPPEPEPELPPEPLIPGLKKLIDDWEDEERLGAQAQERVIRSYLANGFSQEDTLKALLPKEVTDG
jgi:hypothetical protein